MGLQRVGQDLVPEQQQIHMFTSCRIVNANSVLVAQSCLTLCNPMDCSLPGFTVDGIFQARVLSGLPFPSPGDLPNPGIEPRSPSLWVDSFPAEPPGKLEHTGVGSLSLLQWIFLTQELNWGLLHCRQSLYQLRYQGL